jgi:hypothetical protein
MLAREFVSISMCLMINLCNCNRAGSNPDWNLKRDYLHGVFFLFPGVSVPKGEWKTEDIASVGELMLDVSVQLART